MTQTKIGEIVLFLEEEKQEGDLGFALNDMLTEKFNKEENTDLKLKLINIITSMQGILVELQER